MESLQPVIASSVESIGQLCTSPSAIVFLVIAIFAFVLLLFRCIWKAQPLNVRRFKRDVVYLYQFPSFDTILSPSPFALKVETWLRWQNIPYESIRGTDKWSKHGQIPFIELNGEQISDSKIIIEKLQKKFERSDHLGIVERSVAHAFTVMLDNQTVWSYTYFRFLEKMNVYLRKAHFLGTFAKFCARHMGKRTFRSKFYYHGIGRHEREQIYRFGMEDIQALSDYLGSKSFMMGGHMTTVDCVVFAHISEILLDGIDYPHKKYLEEKCENLLLYIKRIKDKVWPDWKHQCAIHLYN